MCPGWCVLSIGALLWSVPGALCGTSAACYWSVHRCCIMHHTTRGGNIRTVGSSYWCTWYTFFWYVKTAGSSYKCISFPHISVDSAITLAPPRFMPWCQNWRYSKLVYCAVLPGADVAAIYCFCCSFYGFCCCCYWYGYWCCYWLLITRPPVVYVRLSLCVLWWWRCSGSWECSRWASCDASAATPIVLVDLFFFRLPSNNVQRECFNHKGWRWNIYWRVLRLDITPDGALVCLFPGMFY